MALLRLEGGEVYGRPEEINARIGPTRVDAVPVPAGLGELLGRPALTADEEGALLAHADAGLEAERRAAGWPPALAQVFYPGMPEALEGVLASYGPPHANPADEIHHVVEGAITFGLVLDGGIQGIVYLQPGDALRLHEGTEHWSALTDDHRVKTILYLSRPPGYAHRYTGTEVRIGR